MRPSSPKVLLKMVPGLALLLLAACASGPVARGDEALEAGRPGEAVEAYREALAEEPGDARIIGKLAGAQEALAEARTREAQGLLTGDAPFEAHAAFRDALEVWPRHREARAGLERARVQIHGRIEAALAAQDYRRALGLIERAQAVGVTDEALAAVHPRARAGQAMRACEEAAAYEAKGLLGNALLAALQAAALEGGGCEAERLADELRGRLARDITVGLALAVEGDAGPPLREPLERWAEETGAPVRVGGPDPTVAVKGRIQVEAARVERPLQLTLERQVGTKTVANPEFVRLRRQLELLLSQVQTMASQLISQQRLADDLYRIYLNTGSQTALENLRIALERLDDLKRRYNDLVRNYNESRLDLSKMQQLLKEPITEEAEVAATDVRVEAQAVGSARIEAPWIEGGGREVPLDFVVGAQDYAWEAKSEQGVPADPVEVPEPGLLSDRALRGAGEKLLEGIQAVLHERADSLLAEARAAQEAGRIDAAVEGYVRALLLDPAAPRPRVRQWLGEVRGATLPVAQSPLPIPVAGPAASPSAQVDDQGR